MNRQDQSKKIYIPEMAVLLAAGRGERLRPYTDKIPKPLLSVNGKPLLDYVLLAVANAGIRRVILVTHYLEDLIKGYVMDGADHNLLVEYVHQSELLGTAHALRCVRQQKSKFLPLNAPFIVTATDYILPPDYLKNLVFAHQSYHADICLSLKQVPSIELSQRSSAHVDEDWKVRRVVEKPSLDSTPCPYVASLSIILPAGAWKYLDKILLSTRGEFEWTDLVNLMIEDGYAAYGHLQPTPGEWKPVE
jgi:NDP-sugar pyrophosphorylase family protein